MPKSKDPKADDKEIEMFLIHWVDDLLLFGNDEEIRLELVESIKSKYELKLEGDNGVASWFLGMVIRQSELGIELLQTAYIEEFFREIFGITEEVSSITTPFDPNIKLSAKDIPESEEEREKLRKKFPMREACGKFIYLRHMLRYAIII